MSQNQISIRSLAVVLWLVPSVMLAVGISRMPYGYYGLLRSVVTICSLGLAGFTRPDRTWRFAWVLVLLGVAWLYNPVFPFRSHKATWTSINFATIILFLSGCIPCALQSRFSISLHAYPIHLVLLPLLHPAECYALPARGSRRD